MYTSDPLHKKLWAKTEGAGDGLAVAAAPQYFTPLRRSKKGTAAHTSRARSQASTSRSPLPPVWIATASPGLEEEAAPPDPTPTKTTTTTVMDPLAALRQCLQYVCSHPEVYGDDIRGLLDREVMHVVRLKASEVALIQSQRPLLVDPLDSTSIRQSTPSFTSPGALPSISTSGSTKTPPFNMPPHPSTGDAAGTRTGASSDNDCVPAGDLFGYGNVFFLPASSAGFRALLRDTRTQMMNSRMKLLSSREEPGSPHLPNAAKPLDETIQWNGTLPPSSSQVAVNAVRKTAGTALAEGGRLRQQPSPPRDDSLADPCSDVNRLTEAQLFREVDEQALGQGYPDVVSSNGRGGGELVAADGSAVVMDHHGYEVTYLRTQLQQLEAAFNAKCVRLHELESENKLFAEQMRASEEAAAHWYTEHHAMEGKLEVLRRELDGWKDRTNDALAAATKQNKQRTQHAKQLASNQINEAKQEAARVSQLWREAERALQESRRAFENTEKEATAAHNHLADAFHYLERLERRVARRDAYVQLCERRHRSLEEKYEKLMWGFEELSTIEGRYSYVDYLLTARPLWSVYLFLALAQHRGDYVVLEDQGELKRQVAIMAAPFAPNNEASDNSAGSTNAEVVEPQSWVLFARTPHGGCYAGSCFDPSLVLRLIVSEVTAEVMRRGRAKQLRTNLHGSVACRVLRWAERYGIDYLGGQDSFPDSGELNRKFVPVLTVASVLLPLRGRSGTFFQTEVSAANAAAAIAPNAKSNGAPVLASLSAPVANTHRYDEATIRFVLRCFWKERLTAFACQMEMRVRAIEAKRQRLGQQRAFKHPRAPSSADVNAPSALRAGEGLTPSDGEDMEEEEDEDDDTELTESAPAFATFLSALVDFATRFTKLSSNVGGSGISTGVPPGVVDLEAAPAVGGVPVPSAWSSPPDAPTLLRVRGVLTRGTSAKSGGNNSSTASKSTGGAAASASDAALWESGRVFFAVILRQHTRNSTSATATAAAASVNNNTATASSMADAPKLNLSESVNDTEVAALSDDVRELLAALYYYTMEYKSHDPDFRLFYLVSHQLIPEMVAVNFFASLESLQRDCAALLEKRVQFLSGERSDCGDAAATLDPEAAEAAAEVDDPLTSLMKTVQIIDDAPLDGQDDEIEADSDGEGYGSIIPFRAKANVHEHAQGASTLSAPSQSSDDVNDTNSESGQKGSGNSSPGTQRRARELRLLHNIRTYLMEQDRKGSDSDIDSKPSPLTGKSPLIDSKSSDGADLTNSGAGASSTTNNLSVFAFGDTPARWTTLEEAVMQRLAPHTALLDAFRLRCGPKATDFTTAPLTSVASYSNTTTAANTKEDRGYLQRKHDDRKIRHEVTKCLSATRGLLTLDDVLALLQRHCFATYAVSCCGTPRFSLTDALMKSSVTSNGRGSIPNVADVTTATTTTSGDLQPYAVVGYLPPTGLQLQRLRFALSLDQPSHLVDVAQLFTVDPVTKANRHLYNTYLTLTLDLFQQQQSFLMQSVLTSCAERHEKYAAEGAEDCDGQVPIASLRKGMTNTLAAVHGSTQHATALVNHFVQYDELLRLEDEVKLEQFADAPLLLNIPAGPTRLTNTIGRDNSFHHSRYPNNTSNNASVNNKSNVRSDNDDPLAAHRRSEATRVMQEVEDAEFNLREEAESCSLLHIAFAVRMTYIVWGRLCANTAAAVVRRVVQRAIPTCRSSAEDTHSQYSSVNAASIKVVELPEWDVFEGHVRQQYALTCERLRSGHNGDDNPLRRTLRGEYVKALGMSSIPPYNTKESAERKLARGVAAAATAAGAFSTTLGVDTSVPDALPLYPDMSHVFCTDSTATPVLTSTAEGGTTTATSGFASDTAEKAKRRGSAAAAGVSPPHASASVSKRTSVVPAPSKDVTKKAMAAALLPDYGLISLSRALGFLSPVTDATATSGGPGGGGALGTSSKRRAANKKAPKKPAVAKKVGGTDVGSISAVAQEEYSRVLSIQLQRFATRVGHLIQVNIPLSTDMAKEGRDEANAAFVPTGSQVNTAGSGGGATTTAGSAAVSEPVCTITFSSVDAEGSPVSTSNARATTRARSVAFVQEARSGHELDYSRRPTVNGDGLAGNGGYPLTWRPVFSEEAREADSEDTSAAAAPNATLNVSKLYAACAALSVL